MHCNTFAAKGIIQLSMIPCRRRDHSITAAFTAMGLARKGVTARAKCNLWLPCFVCVWNISGIAERICATFTWKMWLVPRSDKFEDQVKGQGHQGQKAAFFGGLCAVYFSCINYNETTLSCGRWLKQKIVHHGLLGINKAGCSLWYICGSQTKLTTLVNVMVNCAGQKKQKIG